MGLVAVFDTLAAAIRMSNQADRLLGYPRRGTPIRPGPRSVVPETWDGTGTRPVGWTANACSYQRHPARTEWAVKSPDELDAALVDVRASRLTQVERDELTAIRATLTDRDTWLAGLTPDQLAALKALRAARQST
jgi:hypothetical protein